MINTKVPEIEVSNDIEHFRNGVVDMTDKNRSSRRHVWCPVTHKRLIGVCREINVFVPVFVDILFVSPSKV